MNSSSRRVGSSGPSIFSFDENEPAELFYTSGSTGTPKGVLLSHRTLYLHSLNVLTSWITEVIAYVALHTIPLFHANGWGAGADLPYGRLVNRLWFAASSRRMCCR